jgi:two-component system cell cycle sensor histidine kinase/response regulator CckA
MSLGDSALTTDDVSQFAETGYDKISSIAIVALILGVMGALAPEGPITLVLVTSSVTLGFLGIVVFGLARRRSRTRRIALNVTSEFTEKDAIPSFVVSIDGEVTSSNLAARAIFGDADGQTLQSVLRHTFANPGGILFRLREKAEKEGAAQEDIVTRKGYMRLSVHQMGSDALLWRLTDLSDAKTGRGEGPALPMMIAGRRGAILFMNEAARTLVGQRLKTIYEICPEADLKNDQLVTLSGESGTFMTRLAVVDAGAGRQAVYLMPTEEREEGNLGGDLGSSFEKLPVPLLRIATDGSILSFNAAAAEFVGGTLTKGTQLADLMEGLGRPLVDWLSETASGRAVQHSEFLRLKRPDKEMFVQVALSRVSENDKSSLIAVLSDATELKTLEAQFVQSQKMQAIGQLAGGVAHDFNNLLTAISGHCDRLLLRHDQGDTDYSDLIQINQNSNRAAALVGQLLAFSRKQTLRPEVLDMRDTLSDLTHLLNRLVGEKVSLTLSHDPVLKSIRADKRQLEQVLMNLVVNARDAMVDGGEIRIETESCTLAAPMNRERVTVPAGEYVTVRVVDQGTGISADKLQKVFEPFFTTKRTGEGTGLGLSTAYGIVKQTGGYIFVDSKLGEGTCFTLLFPVLETANRKPIARKVVDKVTAPNHGDGVILLVEDEAPVRAFASRALRLRGYTVLEADSAEAALKTLEDETLNIDLFVTDVVMPGKDGPSWVKEAMLVRPDVRVVFVSGYAEDKLSDTQAKIPNSVFLPKPFSLNDLTETVHRQLH